MIGIHTVEAHFAKSSPTGKVTRTVVGGKGRMPKAKTGVSLRWSEGIRSVGLSLLRRAINVFFPFLGDEKVEVREPTVCVGFCY